MAVILAITHPRGGTSGVFESSARARGHVIEEWSPALDPDPPHALTDYAALVVLGGDQNVCEQDRHPHLTSELQIVGDWLAGGRPLLGVCLGAQLLAQAAGGDVFEAPEPELGWYGVELTSAGRDDPVLGFGASCFSALQWHRYVARPPSAATELARSAACLQAFRIDKAWGVQYHPEVTRAIVAGWIEDSRSSGDAEPAAAFGDLSARLAPWTAYGRELFARFAALAR